MNARQKRGMIRLHAMAERAYRAEGMTAQTNEAKALRLGLEATIEAGQVGEADVLERAALARFGSLGDEPPDLPADLTEAEALSNQWSEIIAKPAGR